MHNFILYTAAVKMATDLSKGSGEPNYLDHYAKDLHEEGFDEEYENLHPNLITTAVESYGYKVTAEAKRRYENQD